MKPLRVIGLSVCSLATGVICLAGGPLASWSELKKQAQAEAKLIGEMLGKGSVDEKTNKRIRGTAMLIAGYTALAKDDAAKLATVRSTAFKLVQAMDKGNMPEAKSLAAALSAEPKTVGPGPTPPLNKVVDFDVIMRLFSRLGLGLERELDEMMELKTFTPDQYEKLTVLGYRLGSIGELSSHFAPEADQGKKTRKSFLQFSGDLQNGSLALAQAARAKKAADVGKHLERISVSCRKCHEVFRDAE